MLLSVPDVQVALRAKFSLGGRGAFRGDEGEGWASFATMCGDLSCTPVIGTSATDWSRSRSRDKQRWLLEPRSTIARAPHMDELGDGV